MKPWRNGLVTRVTMQVGAQRRQGKVNIRKCCDGTVARVSMAVS
jgi:hypothetical protein